MSIHLQVKTSFKRCVEFFFFHFFFIVNITTTTGEYYIPGARATQLHFMHTTAAATACVRTMERGGREAYEMNGGVCVYVFFTT